MPNSPSFPQKNRKFLVLWAFLCAPFIWGVFLTLRDAHTALFMNSAKGTVVGLDTKDFYTDRGHHRYKKHAGIVEFTASDGQVITHTSRYENLFWLGREGYKVKVFYDPQNPYNARVASELWTTSFQTLLVGSGLILFFSLAFYWEKITQKRMQQPPANPPRR